jgi:LysM repeat protein
VLILFILVFFLVVPKGGDGELSRQVAELSDRLQRVEEKLTNMEAPLGGAAQLGSRVDKVEKSLLSFDASNASVASKMNRMADELDQIQKDVSALNSQKNSVKKIPAASSTSGKTQPASQAVYHEVQPGETLYGISRQYNLSVDALRRLNGLSDQASIYPGQKLKVKASGN